MWNVNDGSNENVDVNGETVIRFKESSIFVEPGADFVSTIIDAAKEWWGIGKFKVILNGNEIENEQAPMVFEEGDVVTLVKFEDPA